MLRLGNVVGDTVVDFDVANDGVVVADWLTDRVLDANPVVDSVVVAIIDGESVPEVTTETDVEAERVLALLSEREDDRVNVVLCVLLRVA